MVIHWTGTGRRFSFCGLVKGTNSRETADVTCRRCQALISIRLRSSDVFHEPVGIDGIGMLECSCGWLGHAGNQPWQIVDDWRRHMEVQEWSGNDGNGAKVEYTFEEKKRQAQQRYLAKRGK